MRSDVQIKVDMGTTEGEGGEQEIQFAIANISTSDESEPVALAENDIKYFEKAKRAGIISKLLRGY